MVKFRKILLPILVIALMITFVGEIGYFEADAASSRISFSDPSCLVGNNVTVSVSVSGEVAAATINLVYSTDLLEFVSVSGGQSSGGGGSVRLFNMYNTGAGSMSFSITFKARAAGTAKVTVSGYDIVDGNAEPMDVTAGNSTINITSLSGNSSLASLSISPGTLSPAFSPSTTNYSVSVANSVTSLTVSAQPADGQAKISSITGNSNLKVGNNTVSVTVTAGNGNTTKYNITVNRAAAPADNPSKPNTGTSSKPDKPDTSTSSSKPDTSSSSVSSSVEEPKVLFAKFADGTELEISGEFENDKIPAGFEAVTIEYDGEEINAVSHDGEKGVALYLLGNDKYPTGFYLYDEAEGIVSEIPSYTQEVSYVPVDFPADLELPENYSLSSKEIGGITVSVLVPDEIDEPNHYLLCAINAEGVKNIYMYDIEEGTLQRYDFAEVPEVEEPVVEPELPPEDTSTEEPPVVEEPEVPVFAFLPAFFTNHDLMQYIVLGAAVVLLLLLVVIIILAIKNRKLKKLFDRISIKDPEESIPAPAPKDFVSIGAVTAAETVTADASEAVENVPSDTPLENTEDEYDEYDDEYDN